MSHSCSEPRMSVRKHKHDVHTLTMCRVFWIKHWGVLYSTDVWICDLNMSLAACTVFQWMCFSFVFCLVYFVHKLQTFVLQRTAYFLCSKSILILCSWASGWGHGSFKFQMSLSWTQPNWAFLLFSWIFWITQTVCVSWEWQTHPFCVFCRDEPPPPPGGSGLMQQTAPVWTLWSVCIVISTLLGSPL